MGIDKVRAAQRLWLSLFAALILGATGLLAQPQSEDVIVIGAAATCWSQANWSRLGGDATSLADPEIGRLLLGGD